MKQKKQFIVRKYVIANSAIDVIKKEKEVPVHDIWVNEDYKPENKIGF